VICQAAFSLDKKRSAANQVAFSSVNASYAAANSAAKAISKEDHE
jgi:hypothetical protein